MQWMGNITGACRVQNVANHLAALRASQGPSSGYRPLQDDIDRRHREEWREVPALVQCSARNAAGPLDHPCANETPKPRLVVVQRVGKSD